MFSIFFITLFHAITLKYVNQICEEASIPYYASAGTCLGAIRHKGFIPWDDDMDFAMLRDDYERFVIVAKDELSKDFYLQNFDTDDSFALPFAKVMLNGTVLTERVTSVNSAHKGIYVDIFPFDNVPDSEEKRKKQNRKTYFLKRLLLAKQNYLIAQKGEVLKKIIYFILKCISLFYSKNAIKNLLLTEMKRYNGEETEKVVLFGGSYGYDKESVDRKWFLESTKLDFEDTFFAAPKDYIAYLEYFYGDYMKLPPEDKRYNRHSVVELDFGKYGG